MRKRIFTPQLSALKALEASARLGSFTDAALALNVTQGAISHAIKGIEESLGRKLFVRRHQEIVPTRTAMELATTIREALARIDDAFDRAADDGRRLTVKVQPTVAMRWLMPRLSEFRRAHPTVDLRVTIGWDAVDFSTERFDAGIVWDPDPDERVVATKLFESLSVPVASPAYLAGRGISKEPSPDDRIIHNEPSGEAWGRWLRSSGSPYEDFEAAIATDTDDAAIRLAIAGQGITLATTRFIEEDLTAGRLAIVGTGHRWSNGAYWLVAATEHAEDPGFIAFRDWLVEVATQS